MLFGEGVPNIGGVLWSGFVTQTNRVTTPPQSGRAILLLDRWLEVSRVKLLDTSEIIRLCVFLTIVVKSWNFTNSVNTYCIH